MKTFVGLFRVESEKPLKLAEVSGEGYARAEFTDAGDVQFPRASSEWGAVNFFGVFVGNFSNYPVAIHKLEDPSRVQPGQSVSLELSEKVKAMIRLIYFEEGSRQ